MKKPLRVLMVEDSEDDALLLIRVLKNGGYDPEYKRVQSAETMRAALREKSWDVILCDYRLPQFNGLAAIALLKESGIDIPLIVVSGAIGEETAADCMRCGAHDYVMKGNLSRLVPAIARELMEADSKNKRRQAEKAFQEGEERFRRISSMISDIAYSCIMEENGHFSINWMTGAAERISGYSIAEIKAQRCWRFLVFEEDQTLFEENVTGLTPGSHGLCELRIRHKNGGIIWIASYAECVMGTETPERFVLYGGLVDITERKQAQEELLISEELFRSYLENAPDGVYLSDVKGNFLYGNRKCEEIIGYRREELIGKNFLELNLLSENSLNKAAQLLQANIEGKSTGPDEIELISKEGRRIPVEINTSVVQRMGQRIVLAFVRDITERKRVEDALRESEEKYRDLIKYAPAGIYEVDYETNRFISVNDIICEYTGYTRAELLTMNLFNLLTKESQELMLARLEKLMAGEKTDPTVEYCIRTKNGNELWALFNARYIYEAGKLKGATGVVYNITERKRAEDALRESKELFSLFMRHSPVYAYIKEVTPTESRVLQASDNYDQMIGIPGPKMIGRTMVELFPSEFAAKITADDWAVVSSGNVLQQEEDLNGRNYATIKFPIVQREKTLLAGYTIDITDRKRGEEELRESLEQLRRAVAATIQVLVMAVEMKDPYTAGHQRRMTNLARTMATEMGLPPEKIEGLRMAGVIHDIGKITLPTEILSKPTKLSDIEFSLIREHVRLGYDILKDVESPWSLAEIVLQHHERMDGSGYPRGLKGEEILIEARILAVADVVEAMASHRPYRPALGLDAALEEIEKNRGLLYDSHAVDTCLRVFREKGYQIEGI